MSDNESGSNCTDETKREAYRAALIAKIAEEHAKAGHDKKLGEYRSVLKKYSKMGVSTDAITYALKVRMDDPDETLIAEREKLKMLDLSGHLPGIKDKLLARLDVEEATTHEADNMDLAKAGDLGAQAGRAGASRDVNPYLPGTEMHVHFVEGWLSGQRAIADEMEANAPPPVGEVVQMRRGRGRPKKTAAETFAADTAETVARAAAEDGGEGIPDIVA
jgi:ribosome modulation factor